MGAREAKGVVGFQCLALLLCFPSLVLGMYEDQQGTYDWYKSYVGHVTSASFHKTKPRVYLGTEQGVAGSLNLRDGSIAWRQRLEEEDGVHQSFLLETPGPTLFVSVSGGTLRAWDPTEGLFKWSTQLGDANRAVAVVLGGARPAIAAFGGDQIKIVDGQTGEEVSTIKVQAPAAKGSTLQLQSLSDGDIGACSYLAGSSFLTCHLIQDSTATTHSLTSPHPLSSTSVSGPWGIAAITTSGQQLCVTSWELASPALDCTPLSAFAPSLAPVHGLQQQTVQGRLSLQMVATETGVAMASGSSDQPTVVLVSLLESPTLIKAFPTASAVSTSVQSGAGEVVCVVEARGTSGVVLQYVTTSSGQVVASDGSVKGSSTGLDKLAPGAKHPQVRAAVLGSFKKKDGADGFRVLLIWSDERVALSQQGVVVWFRDESLAGIKHVLFSDLPTAKAAANSPGGAEGGEASSMQRFLRLQLLTAKVQFKIASPQETLEHGQLRAALSDKNIATRDTRGFRRSLIVSTSSGKVAALHNGDGRVLWSRPGGLTSAPQHLLPWTTFHDLTHAPLIATLNVAEEAGSMGQGGATQVQVLDAHTGAVTSEEMVPCQVDKLLSLGKVPAGAHAEQDLYLALSFHSFPSEGRPPSIQARLLPDTEGARSFFSTYYKSIHFYLDLSQSKTGTALQGYGFNGAAAAALSHPGGSASAHSLWSFSLKEPLLAVTAHDPADPIHSSVKVLGDRSMKIRYLSPNLLVVVTGAPPGTIAEEEEAGMGGAAHIMLVDGVTGALLYRQTVPGCRGPAVVKMVENLAVVQLWDSASARYMVTSLEIFDASDREFSVLDALFNPNATQPLSSNNIPPLEVLTSSFFSRLPAKQYATTITRAGITSKLLLVLTTNDQVYSMDLRFVDPRRPRRAKLTAQEVEERLIPYQDSLPVSATSFLTYNKQVLGLRGLLSAPSRLESTSLVFSWGIDLQYTRIAPAKSFDSLDDEFSFGLLVVMLVGLTGATVFMHYYTKASKLKSKWA